MVRLLLFDFRNVFDFDVQVKVILNFAFFFLVYLLNVFLQYFGLL